MKNLPLYALAAIVLGATVLSPIHANLILNGDFEEFFDSLPESWRLSGSGEPEPDESQVQPAEGPDGSRAVELSSENASQRVSITQIVQNFPFGEGKVKISGKMRVMLDYANPRQAGAALRLNIWTAAESADGIVVWLTPGVAMSLPEGDFRGIQLPNLQTDWEEVSAVVAVPPDAIRVAVTMDLSGSVGKVEFADICLEPVDDSTPEGPFTGN
jgi:hypothetical protein